MSYDSSPFYMGVGRNPRVRFQRDSFFFGGGEGLPRHASANGLPLGNAASVLSLLAIPPAGVHPPENPPWNRHYGLLAWSGLSHLQNAEIGTYCMLRCNC